MLSFAASLSPNSEALAIFVTEKYDYKDKRDILSNEAVQKINSFLDVLKVKKTNVAIIMVEQNAKQALSIADRGYVLVTGENKFSGTGKELLNDPEVRRSFLGGWYGFYK